MHWLLLQFPLDPFQYNLFPNSFVFFFSFLAIPLSPLSVVKSEAICESIGNLKVVLSTNEK